MQWRYRFLVVAMMLLLPTLTPGCGDLPVVLTQPPTSSPVGADPAVLQNVIAISAGWSHTCALTSAGVVTCWGDNGEGQLGDGTTINRLAPAMTGGVSLASAATAVATGGGHTCAQLVDGQIMCWGDNVFGQLGDGTRDDHAKPAPVVGLTDAPVALAAGEFHTCALLVDGTVSCWGWNDEAQLGDYVGIMRATAGAVDGIRGATALAVGARHNCVLDAAGGVLCWGGNWEGQIGNGRGTRAYRPAAPAGLDGAIVALAAGNTHTCALRADDSATCWGGNSVGQLGDGTRVNRLAPVDAVGFANPLAGLDSGGGHTCGWLMDGDVQCLGGNWKGQLGDGTVIDQLDAVQVNGLPMAATAVATGEAHTCALLANSTIACWGNNNAGQLGDGTGDDRSIPVWVTEATAR